MLSGENRIGYIEDYQRFYTTPIVDALNKYIDEKSDDETIFQRLFFLSASEKQELNVFAKKYYPYLHNDKKLETLSSHELIILGVFLSYGFGGFVIDPAKVVQCYEFALTKQHPLAYCGMGYCYNLGLGLERNIEKAVQFYQKSIELGCSLAKANLITINWEYLFGIEISHDINDAASLYMKAKYNHTVRTPPNLNKAKIYYQAAARLGYNQALIDLAQIYIKEPGAPQINLAYDLLLIAYGRDRHGLAAFWLGILTVTKNRPFTNKSLAAKYFEEAIAKQAFMGDSHYLLATILHEAPEPRDLVRIVYHFRKACEGGIKQAEPYLKKYDSIVVSDIPAVAYHVAIGLQLKDSHLVALYEQTQCDELYALLAKEPLTSQAKALQIFSATFLFELALKIEIIIDSLLANRNARPGLPWDIVLHIFKFTAIGEKMALQYHEGKILQEQVEAVQHEKARMQQEYNAEILIQKLEARATAVYGTLWHRKGSVTLPVKDNQEITLKANTFKETNVERLAGIRQSLRLK